MAMASPENNGFLEGRDDGDILLIFPFEGDREMEIMEDDRLLLIVFVWPLYQTKGYIAGFVLKRRYVGSVQFEAL